MNISLLIFGQFRSYKQNLENNLNIIESLFFLNNNINIFILTDKNINGNYSIENENDIITILNKFKNINFIKIFYWEDLTNYHKEEYDNEIKYNINCKHRKGKNLFTSNLWYRRYILNLLKNNFASENNIIYDINFFIRIFDIKIDINNNCKEIINIEMLKNDTLLMSIDTIFIGNTKIMDKLFEFGNKYDLYHDEDIWNNNEFIKQYNDIDSCLVRGKYTYCSEVQIFSYIFFNITNYKNIRVDFNNEKNPINNYNYLRIKLDPDRK